MSGWQQRQGRRDRLGEGITWSPRRNAIFWVDILSCSLQRLDLDSGRVQRWGFPEPIGWAVERAGFDGLIVGLKSGFYACSLDPFELTSIGNPEPDRPHNRLNDAKVDHEGRIWAGSKDDREEGAEPAGALYRLDPDRRWSRQADGYQITNGPTFSPDGRVLYHADTINRLIFTFDMSAEGILTNKREFIRFDDSMGYPDGMTTDALGGIWVAHWGGGRVSRFHPDGRFDRAIALPTSQITNCTFAGSGLDRMFVTSAAVGKETDPMAGGLFEVDPGVTGLPPTPFAG
jgi:sugar lactone lactonase YvrE